MLFRSYPAECPAKRLAERPFKLGDSRSKEENLGASALESRITAPEKLMLGAAVDKTTDPAPPERSGPVETGQGVGFGQGQNPSEVSASASKNSSLIMKSLILNEDTFEKSRIESYKS